MYEPNEYKLSEKNMIIIFPTKKDGRNNTMDNRVCKMANDF